jgi:hypothetical protein
MMTIRDIIRYAFATRILSIAAEARLKQLLKTHYETADLRAYCLLRQAMLKGIVRQESRELRDRRFEPTRMVEPMWQSQGQAC